MPLANLTATSSFPSLSLPPNTYIYQILPTCTTTTSLAAISSDDSLRLVNPNTLQERPDGVLKNVHTGVTCLEKSLGHDDGAIGVWTAGRDGIVKWWDLRMKGTGVEFSDINKAPFLSLCCNDKGPIAGTEFTNSEASMLIWDKRNPTTPSLRYTESHNDDITTLSPHPTLPHLLLSGSTDGLLNVYDLHHSDEDDALIQVVNHGRSIHHAGFLSPERLFGLSHDEHMAVYGIDGEGKGDDIAFGDLRERLGCECIVDVVSTFSGSGVVDDESAVIGAGSHSKSYLDLVPLRSGAGSPKWKFDVEKRVRLPGAHGEEIVRSMCFIGHNAVFTAGEDGKIRAWRIDDGGEMNTEIEMEGVESETPRKKKKKNKRDSVNASDGKGRFKPY